MRAPLFFASTSHTPPTHTLANTYSRIERKHADKHTGYNTHTHTTAAAGSAPAGCAAAVKAKGADTMPPPNASSPDLTAPPL